MKYLSSVAFAAALAVQSAAAISAPICVTKPTSSGFLEVDQTYVKMQVRNYSSTKNTFELWVSPRTSGNTSACVDTIKGQTKISYSPGGVQFTIQSNPQCNANAWGYAAITLQDGTNLSDGGKQYVGRVPLKLDEWSSVDSTHYYYLRNYDYSLVLNADKSVRQLCADVVSGSMDTGSSSYWKPSYPTEG
nr:hypothetical protein [uncultured Sphingorhabdus sp.]